MEKSKTYEEGLKEGFNYACRVVLEALGINIKEEEPKEKKVYNKPRK
jgi:hypothetical protein